jgi:hypothetical protein
LLFAKPPGLPRFVSWQDLFNLAEYGDSHTYFEELL